MKSLTCTCMMKVATTTMTANCTRKHTAAGEQNPPRLLTELAAFLFDVITSALLPRFCLTSCKTANILSNLHQTTIHPPERSIWTTENISCYLEADKFSKIQIQGVFPSDISIDFAPLNNFVDRTKDFPGNEYKLRQTCLLPTQQ